MKSYVEKLSIFSTPDGRMKKVFSTNKEVVFKPGLNLLIGPNGSGKSTIIKCLSKKSKDYFVYTKDNAFIEFSFIDTENTHRNSHVATNALHAYSRWMSHGEWISDLLMTMERVETEVIIVDEPESALDHNNLLQFIDVVRGKSENHQIIISTHSFLILYMLKDIANIIELKENYWADMERYYLNILKGL